MGDCNKSSSFSPDSAPSPPPSYHSDETFSKNLPAKAPVINGGCTVQLCCVAPLQVPISGIHVENGIQVATIPISDLRRASNPNPRPIPRRCQSEASKKRAWELYERNRRCLNRLDPANPDPRPIFVPYRGRVSEEEAAEPHDESCRTSVDSVKGLRLAQPWKGWRSRLAEGLQFIREIFVCT